MGTGPSGKQIFHEENLGIPAFRNRKACGDRLPFHGVREIYSCLTPVLGHKMTDNHVLSSIARADPGTIRGAGTGVKTGFVRHWIETRRTSGMEMYVGAGGIKNNYLPSGQLTFR